MVKIKELKKLTPGELFSEYKKIRLALEKLKSESGFHRLKDYSQICKTRRQIARILTILNESNNEANN